MSDQLLLVTRSATGSRGSGAGAGAAREPSVLWRAQPTVASGWATHQAIAKSRTNRIGDCVIGVLASLPSPEHTAAHEVQRRDRHVRVVRHHRSEERRVGKEWRTRWGADC